MTAQESEEEYWPATEALPLLSELEELVYKATGARPFFQWNGDPKAVTEAGAQALEKIKARFREIEEALY